MESLQIYIDNQEVNWSGVMLELTAFANGLIKAKSWFRKKSDSFLQGKTCSDYVMEAITWHLENPEKYDPSRGTFIKYLKYNILRRMIHNDATSKENRKTRDVFGEKIKDGNDPSDHYDSILPSIEEYFEDNIDYDTIMKAVEKKCENDDIAYKIFYEVCLCGGKRREVCREQKMAEKEYDNGIRRLNTILEEIAIQFQLKTQSL